jgi:hypothetical protein
MTKQDEMMLDYPPSLAATKKLGGVTEGFAFFAFEWLGDRPEEWTVMKCSGAVFRAAKSGPRKGERCVKVAGTDRNVFVTDAEIKAETPNDRVEGRDAALSRRVPSHDGLEGNGTGRHE